MNCTNRLFGPSSTEGHRVFKTPVLETSKKINGLQQGFEYETKGYTCVCLFVCVFSMKEKSERVYVREKDSERER